MKRLQSLFAAALILCFSLGSPRLAAADNLVEIASGSSSFTTLVAAVEAAGLTEALSSEGPFTLFAPTNEAFAKVPAETLETLLQPENQDTLATVLRYHVVPYPVYSTDLAVGFAKTLAGQQVAIALGEPVRINEAAVLVADIEADNGVVHVIDRVLMPPNL